MPDFSIITPVLNQVSTIETCILSVATQEIDVEHIIIDGGSTDGTIDVIRQHERKLKYWVSEPDQGQSHAINKGLELASGRWFNWLNADDQLRPHALQTVMNIAEKSSQVVVGKCEHINQNAELLDTGSARIWHSLEATLGNYSMGQPSVFYRTEIVKQLGGMNENLHLCLDMDLWFRFLIKFGQENIRTSDKVLSWFLVHGNSKSSTQAEAMKTEKYGIYHALLVSQELPEVLKKFFSSYPIPNSVRYQLPSNLGKVELLSYFAWHLMVDAYKKKDFEMCRAYFELVKQGSALSNSQRLVWKTQISASTFFG